MTQPSLIERQSPLYDRYNGFLLGAFFAAAATREGRPHYAHKRQRMAEFLEELDIRFEFPEAHEAYCQRQGRLAPQITEALRPRGVELLNFFLLGSAAVQHGGTAEADERKALRTLGHRILDAHELPRELWDARLVVSGHRKATPLKLSMALLEATLLPLSPEADTCFVAQPLGGQGASRYRDLYREVLEACGRRALRSWGGFGGERRQEMLVELIRHCGALLADLSGFGQNVVFKLGVARGAGLRVFLFTGTPEAVPPMDLDLSWISVFDPAHVQWLSKARRDGLYFISAVDAVLDSDGMALGDVSPAEVIQRLQQAERFSLEAQDSR